MYKNVLKKWVSIILALVMILSCTAVSAGTVYTKVSVNVEAAKEILTGFGVPEDQMAIFSPILSLINVLGVKVITAEDGGQIDLDLNGESALSLGFAADEQGIRLASTLFPNYVLNLKQETLGQMMEMLMSNMPGMGIGGTGEGFMSIMPTSPMTYFNSFVQVCSEAAVPGEPVKGEYVFEGNSFDTLVPVTVNVPAVKEAFHGLAEDMFRDEAVVSSLQGCAGMIGMDLDPEQLKAGLVEFEAHFPDTVTAEYYQNGEVAVPFYVTGRANYEGKEGPSYEYSMLFKGENDFTVSFLDHEQGISAGLLMTDERLYIEFKQGEVNFALDLTSKTGEPVLYQCDLYFMNTEKPLISVAVTITADGTRTLPVDGEGKTLLAVEDLLNGGSEAGNGLMTDLMMNGLAPLLAKLSQIVPDAAGLITMLMTPQTNQKTSKDPIKEDDVPQVEVDPSSWKTLSDVLALHTESRESSWSDGTYFLIIRYAGTEWLVVAAVSEEQSDAAFAVDFRAEDRDEQINAILGPCEIQTVIDLGTLAMTQKELDPWIGKTGQDLLDAGWEYNGYHSDETGIHICMVNGDFQYLVSFAEELLTGQVFGEQPENMATATISGITFDGKSYNFNEMNYIVPAEDGKEDGHPDIAPEAATRTYQLGTSVYTVEIPVSFTEGKRTEEEIRDDMVAYMRSDETLLDFDVYQFAKEGLPEKLAEYVEQEAAEYKAFEVKTNEKINGIDTAWYRAKETYDGKEYTTLSYLLDEGDQYVEIAFWLDGETAEEEAQAIINTLTFVQR